MNVSRVSHILQCCERWRTQGPPWAQSCRPLKTTSDPGPSEGPRPVLPGAAGHRAGAQAPAPQTVGAQQTQAHREPPLRGGATDARCLSMAPACCDSTGLHLASTAAAVTPALSRLLGQPVAGFLSLCVTPKHSCGLPPSCTVTPTWLPLSCTPTASIGAPSPAPLLPGHC